MNVGHPSNLARIVAFYRGIMNETGTIIKQPDMDQMREDLFAVSVTDEETRSTIDETFKKYNFLLEPHGAIAWKGLKEYSGINKRSMTGKSLSIALETAHPAKFPLELQQILNIYPPLPNSLSGLEMRPEDFVCMENNYGLLKDFILKYFK
jgi:threonine synthase